MQTECKNSFHLYYFNEKQDRCIHKTGSKCEILSKFRRITCKDPSLSAFVSDGECTTDQVQEGEDSNNLYRCKGEALVNDETLQIASTGDKWVVLIFDENAKTE